MKRYTKATFVLIVCMAAFFTLGNLTRGHNWGGDFAAYIMQAISIVEADPGGFIETNRFTIEQSSYPIGAIAYPWGYPLLLAPIYALFGLNIVALKAVGVVAFLLFLGLFWVAFRDAHSDTWLLWLVSLFALNPILIKFTDDVLSDIPFLFASTLSIWLIQKFIVAQKYVVSRPWSLILLGASTAAAFAIRTNGILLLVTLGLSYIFAGSWTTAPDEKPLRENRTPRRFSIKRITPLLIPGTVFFGAILLIRLFLPGGGNSYLSLLRHISIAMIRNHASIYLELSAKFFADIPHSSLLYGASLPLAIAGAFRRYRQDFPAILYVVLTLSLYILWPITQGIRFLFPILPFYISFTCSGLEAFGENHSITGVERFIRKLFSYAPVALVVIFFLIADLRALNDNRAVRNDGPFTASSQEMFTFIENHTEQESVIVFFKPRVMKLMTARQAVMITHIDQLSRGDYLCIYLRDDKDQVPASEIAALAGQARLQPIYENADFRVYRMAGFVDEINP